MDGITEKGMGWFPDLPDRRDLTLEIEKKKNDRIKDMSDPRAIIIPKNSRNRVVTGFPKKNSFSIVMVTRVVRDSSIGKDSIFPIAMAYFPWLFELNTLT